jgi:glycosyltransferase involved in cell wall biosynthesis
MPDRSYPSTLSRTSPACWKQEFRNHWLRPSNPLRRLLSRKLPWLNQRLPDAKLPLDKLRRIRRNPRRVEVLRRILALDLFDCEDYLRSHPEPADKANNPLARFLFEQWDRSDDGLDQPALRPVLDRAFPRAPAGAVIRQIPKTDGSRPLIGIYNAYWNTGGGAERHALMIAWSLRHVGEIELIGETDFDPAALAAGFGIDLGPCRKRVLPFIDTADTAGYDLFFNSTHESSLISACPRSYYLVSFPHRLPLGRRDAAAFLASYRFLANSRYTRGWITRLWKTASEVLHPCASLPAPPASVDDDTQPLILHVGRFFRGGHNKKQAEVAAVFSDLKKRGLLPSAWRLALAGKVHPPDHDYMEAIRTRYSADGVEIYDNCPHGRLVELYEQAALYWHATGLGEDPVRAPQKFEHFGITLCEAMAAGCVPIAHRQGGAAEIIDPGRDGHLFDTADELAHHTRSLALLRSHDRPAFARLQTAARQKARSFDAASFPARLATLLEPVANHEPLSANFHD